MLRRQPNTKTVSIGQDRIEYLCSGNGRPGIVLVNGSGGPIAGWHKVLPRLVSTSTTLAYSRPGIGTSSPAQSAETLATVTGTLHALLTIVELPQPFILVGHSLGGLIVNLYARLYPWQTAGVILLEAATPDDMSTFGASSPRSGSKFGRLLDIIFPSNPHAETLHLKTSVEQIEAAPPFPDIPLFVVTGTKRPFGGARTITQQALRNYHQERLVQLSPQGIHLHAPGSGHFPQLTEPDLVVAVVTELVNSVRSTQDP